MMFISNHYQVYRCNDNVPEAVYWELPKRIQNQVKSCLASLHKNALLQKL